MKKNVMMRVASVLMVAVLLTTCAISGTFAKYVTSDNVSDTARVAKWGVTVTTTGTLFAESYKDIPVVSATDTDDTITVQVKDYASVEQNVVAPGTKNETGMTFQLKGTPEVDTNVVIALDVKDIVLPAGTYKDYTTGKTDDTFTIDTDYTPVVFTLYNKDKATVLATGTAKTIETYLEGLSKVYQTNTDLSTIATNTNGEYVLTWAWAFDGNDKADTYLGNVAAGIVDDAPAGCSTDVSVGITITVTQVD